METTSEPRRWISTVDTAKLIRSVLKRAFPGTKFSVRSRSYSGGSAILIRWTDGPTDLEVSGLTDGFEGGGFDGSIDLAYYIESWLRPDGTATPARSPGTEGSRGSVPAFDNPRPQPDAELVAFSAKYVSTSRETSLDLERIGRDLCELQGREFVDLNQRGLMGTGDPRDLYEHVARLLAQTSIPTGAVYAGLQRFDGSDPFAWAAIYFAE